MPGQEAQEDRLHAGENIGDTGEVGNHVIAIEPKEGQKLMDHFELQEKNDGDQDFEVRQEINAERCEHEKSVEVDPAKVRAEAAPLAQAVGVRNIRVEGRPHQVNACAHHAWARAAVSAAGGMAALMEGGRENH